MVDLNDIADLIQSLGKAEKRFFKMMASTEGTDVDLLVKLFDELEKQVVSVEKLERSGYYSEYDVTKLYDLILKSLRNFYAESDTVLRYEDEILNLRCLVDKAQYKQCRKMLISLKRELYESERFDFLLSVFELEKKLITFEESKSSFLQPSIIAKEEQSIVDKKMALLNLNKLYWEIKNSVTTEADVLELYLLNPFLAKDLPALSRKECALILRCRQIIFARLGKINEVSICKQGISELLEKYSFLRDYFKELSISAS